MERNRYLNPNSRLDDSPYKVDLKNRQVNEDLIVNIYKEDGSLYHSYHFDAEQLQGRKSIHFKDENENIEWSPKELKYTIVK